MKFIYLLSYFFSSLILAAEENDGYEKMVQLCKQLTQDHPSVLSSKSLLDSAKEEVKVQVGVFYPNLNLDLDQSFTKLSNHNSTNPEQHDRDMSVSISQLIYDFGKSNNEIKVAIANVQKREYDLENATQNILLSGLELCLDYTNTWRQVQFQSVSADNFKRQMDLEKVKVKKGQGYSTDVLQAEAQWLGAKNRKVQLNAALKRHRHNFEALFGNKTSINVLNGVSIRKGDVEIPDYLRRVQRVDKKNPATSSSNLSVQLVSESEAEFDPIQLNLSNLVSQNPRLKSLKNSIYQQELNRTTLQRNRFAPELRGVISGDLSHSDSPINPFQREGAASLQLSFPFNLGLTALNEVSALSSRIGSLEHDYEIERRNFINNLKDHIINWEASLESINLLKRQVTISKKFLEGAEKERTMGRRSLIDVINGELILIRAKSDLEQAEIQALKSWFRYLSTIGKLAHDKL